MKKFSWSFGGGAREAHSQPIYCVAWSDDLHIIEEEIVPKQKERNDDSEEEKEESAVGNNKSNHDEKTQTTTRCKLCRYMATCGGNQLTLYEVEEKTMKHYFKETASSSTSPSSSSSSKSVAATAVVNNPSGFRARQVYIDVDAEELFYSCLFVGRGVGTNSGYEPTFISLETKGNDNNSSSGSHITATNDGVTSGSCNNNIGVNHGSNDKKRKRQDERPPVQPFIELSNNDGPQLCCVGGRRGIIKIIDTVRMSLLLTLSGHGNEIYDMSINPTNPWLLISASKDESLRLWNIKNAQCLAIFAGHEGHRDAVLSVDWHPLGEMFVSSGMDETIKIWSVKGEEVSNAIELDRRGDHENFRTVYQQLPLFSSSMIHTNYGE